MAINVSVSLGNNRASFTWEQSCQFNFSLGSNYGGVTSNQWCHSPLGTIVPAPLEKNCAIVTGNNRGTVIGNNNDNNIYSNNINTNINIIIIILI